MSAGDPDRDRVLPERRRPVQPTVSTLHEDRVRALATARHEARRRGDRRADVALWDTYCILAGLAVEHPEDRCA